MRISDWISDVCSAYLRHRFSWINEWTELTDRARRPCGLEFIIPDWLYQGILDRSLVLAIEREYFRLTGGIARWLYRVARKPTGRKPAGWHAEERHVGTERIRTCRPRWSRQH